LPEVRASVSTNVADLSIRSMRGTSTTSKSSARAQSASTRAAP